MTTSDVSAKPRGEYWLTLFQTFLTVKAIDQMRMAGPPVHLRDFRSRWARPLEFSGGSGTGGSGFGRRPAADGLELLDPAAASLPITTLVVAAVVVFLMVYVVMPRYTRLVQKWLFT